MQLESTYETSEDRKCNFIHTNLENPTDTHKV